MTMPDETAAQHFFADLASKRHVALLEGTSGTLLVELTDGAAAPQRWFVRIKRGDVSVSDATSTPDCVLATDAATFEAIVAGRINAFAAMLRGLLEVDGQIHLLVALQAFFRPSAGAEDQPTAGYAGRRR
jgi:putative sterol carrier protein